MRQSELGEHESTEPEELYKDEEWLRERWFSDKTALSIAEEAGCGDQTIHNWAREFGFPPKGELITASQPYRDEEWLRERWFSDMTVMEIVEEAGSCKSSILRWAERFDFPPKEETRSWFDAELIGELYYDEGMSAKEVGDELGCSGAAVRGTMERNDMERRGPADHLTKPSAIKTRQGTAHEQISFTALNGNTHYYNVHRMLAIAEFGLDEVAGQIVHHKNGIPWDNRPDNLELIESQAKHAKLHSAERERDELGRYV